jgi:hypothetical protein
MTNVNGNWKKNLPAKYSRVTAAKGKIRQSVSSTKKWAVGMGKKASGEQRFLGKTLPKALWKTAKWGFRHPITATALTFVPAAMRKIAKSPGLKFPKHRQFDKRGRKII